MALWNVKLALGAEQIYKLSWILNRLDMLFVHLSDRIGHSVYGFYAFDEVDEYNVDHCAQRQVVRHEVAKARVHVLREVELNRLVAVLNY